MGMSFGCGTGGDVRIYGLWRNRGLAGQLEGKEMIEMIVKEANDRLAVAAALLKNGYVVWFESRKEGKAYKQFVCASLQQKRGKRADATIGATDAGPGAG